MSDYTSCVMEFKKDCTELTDAVRSMDGNCFCEGYITDDSVIVHFNGNRFNRSPEWNALVRVARSCAERDSEVFHTMVWSAEYAIEDDGCYCEGHAYVGLCCDGGKHFLSFKEMAGEL